MNKKFILITGCAGFIGFHLCNKFLKQKKLYILGVDNLNKNYDLSLKKERLKILKNNKNFIFLKINLSNYSNLLNSLKKFDFNYIFHLAAQAGVRDSIKKPDQYFKNNIKAFYNILKLSNHKKIHRLFYASSSSVYGDDKIPSKEKQNTDMPKSFYAASKKINEITAFSFSNIYGLKSTGLRFFTVYGPYGRPDMAIFKFTKNIKNNKPINLYNYGKNQRDFTYIDDVIDAIINLYKYYKKNYINNKNFSIYNIGNGKSITNKKLVEIIKLNLKKDVKIIIKDRQKGDVDKTLSENSKLKRKIGFSTKTSIQKGIVKFLNWYSNYYE